MSVNSTLYHKIVEVTAEYLGPAASRFVDRQIENHLDKKPDKLTNKDLATLAEWATVAMASLTDNEELVAEYRQRLERLDGYERR